MSSAKVMCFYQINNFSLEVHVFIFGLKMGKSSVE